MQASKRKLEDLRASGGDHVYFAKFLTSEKVIKLFDFKNQFIMFLALVCVHPSKEYKCIPL